MKPHKGMKPQDIVILLYIMQYCDGIFKVADLSRKLGISQSEVSESLNRSRIGRLLGGDKKVLRTGFYEFLIYGLRYVFPLEPGSVVRGVPAAHSGPPLDKMILSGNDPYVWKSSDGGIRGISLEPLYPTLPSICQELRPFYELCCLVDVLRIGKVREVNLAREILLERICKDES